MLDSAQLLMETCRQLLPHLLGEIWRGIKTLPCALQLPSAWEQIPPQGSGEHTIRGPQGTFVHKILGLNPPLKLSPAPHQRSRERESVTPYRAPERGKSSIRSGHTRSQAKRICAYRLCAITLFGRDTGSLGREGFKSTPKGPAVISCRTTSPCPSLAAMRRGV